MKKIIINLVAILGLLTTSCSQMNEETKVDTSQMEMISIGKELAQLHNECLEKIYTDFTSNKISRNVEGLSVEERFLLSVNEFVKQKLAGARTAEPIVEITMEDVEKTIEEIEASLSEKEKFYIDKAQNLDADEDIENLLIQIVQDENLPDANKQAVICFITTFEASNEYWEAHANEWYEMLGKPVSRVNWGMVATSDAWYGYQAMLASALNPIVSGGAAAFASGLALMFSLYIIF